MSMSNYHRSVEPSQASRGDEETYNILVLLGIMGYLGDSNCAADLLAVLVVT